MFRHRRFLALVAGVLLMGVLLTGCAYTPQGPDDNSMRHEGSERDGGDGGGY